MESYVSLKPLTVLSKTKMRILEFEVRKLEESFVRSVHDFNLLIRTNLVLLDSSVSFETFVITEE